MSGDSLFDALEQEATKAALKVLQEKGAQGLTNGEALVLKLGVACGIQAAVNKFVGKDEKRKEQDPDHFAE